MQVGGLSIRCNALPLGGRQALRQQLGQLTAPVAAYTGGLSELLPDVPGVVSEAPSLQYCKAGDVCCQHSASPADCASTASKAKGCRSFTACVPAQDPCLAATNKTSCLAAGHHCRCAHRPGDVTARACTDGTARCLPACCTQPRTWL